MLQRMFESTGNEATWKWAEIHKENLRNLLPLTGISTGANWIKRRKLGGSEWWKTCKVNKV